MLYIKFSSLFHQRVKGDKSLTYSIIHRQIIDKSVIRMIRNKTLWMCYVLSLVIRLALELIYLERGDKIIRNINSIKLE
jgi:hypothetical protein